LQPDRPSFGGGVADTVLHPIVLIVMLIGIMLIFILPRKSVIFPVLFTTFLVPIGQQFYFAGIHLFVLRIIILMGLIRALSSKGPSQRFVLTGGWNSVDTAFSICIMAQAVAVVLLNQDLPSVINQVGFVWDCLGGYILLRSLIRNENDVYRTIKCFAVLAVILAICMVIEQKTLTNVFGLLKGVRATPEIRDGKIRSQGVFQHSLTAGAFAAPLVPLFFLLWKNGKAKAMAAVGVIAATTMTVATQTSSSLLTYAAGLLAMFLWPLRKNMRMVRWAFGLGLLTLHLAMKAPVWFLIARIDLTGSSSSYHRAELIDQFIRNFRDWLLLGTKDTANWGWDMWDVQNQYVAVGEAGGLLAFVFFIAVISRSFGRLGDARKKTESTDQQWVLWFLGSAVFANVVSFFGVNYFDQSKMAWYALLAMIPAYTAVILRPPKTPVRVEIHPEDFAVSQPSRAPEACLTAQETSSIPGSSAREKRPLRWTDV
jgi:hypothetical protein